MLTFRTISGETLVFINMSIGQITEKICQWIDQNICEPEDLENFINQSNYQEIYRFINND